MVDENGKRWHPVIAALANPDVRVAFGLLAVGDLSAATSPISRPPVGDTSLTR